MQQETLISLCEYEDLTTKYKGQATTMDKQMPSRIDYVTRKKTNKTYKPNPNFSADSQWP